MICQKVNIPYDGFSLNIVETLNVNIGGSLFAWKGEDGNIIVIMLKCQQLMILKFRKLSNDKNPRGV